MYKIHYRKDFDPLLIILPLVIFGIGLLFLHSASSSLQEIKGINFTLRQITWMLVSILALILLINIDFRRILDFSYIFYGIVIVILSLLLVIGGAKMGAKRWINIGHLTFQPSEFAKLALILVSAFYLGNNKYSIRSIKSLLIPFLLTGVLFILIIKEPDLGSSIVLLPILLAMLLASGMPLKFIFSSILIGAMASPLFWQILKDYQKRRLLVFINPNMDPLGAGYTIIQSKIAIGSGGLSGKGWMSGTQNQLNFLPERHTDFIFSVVGEEWGFMGSLLVILLFALLISRILDVARRTNDIYGRLLVVGVAAMLCFQVIVNIAMTVGLMPVVGLPLPFISYGGSSLISSVVCIALVINVDMHRTIF